MRIDKNAISIVKQDLIFNQDLKKKSFHLHDLIY